MHEDVTQNPQNLSELNASYRKIKHDINNALGVMMALAELAQRNPANQEKLINAVLERCPMIVEKMQAFGQPLQALAEAETRK